MTRECNTMKYILSRSISCVLLQAHFERKSLVSCVRPNRLLQAMTFVILSHGFDSGIWKFSQMLMEGMWDDEFILQVLSFQQGYFTSKCSVRLIWLEEQWWDMLTVGEHFKIKGHYLA
jgi:hypothetical protein